jgi:hypothetical protein
MTKERCKWPEYLYVHVIITTLEQNPGVLHRVTQSRYNLSRIEIKIYNFPLNFGFIV